MADESTPVYFWYYTCPRHCSFLKQSVEPTGDSTWSTETCPYDGEMLTEVKAG